MSRSQRNARMSKTAKKAPMGGTAKGEPEGVTEKDGSQNIAGTVNRFTTDDYKGMQVVKENR